jgi:hypothetical protein
MLRFLREIVLYRILGGRVMLALTVGSWLLGKIRGRRSSSATSYPRRRAEREGLYQPSQGESQIVHREPR